MIAAIITLICTALLGVLLAARFSWAAPHEWIAVSDLDCAGVELIETPPR